MKRTQRKSKKSTLATDGNATPSQPLSAKLVTEEAIRERAYRIFQARGDVPGDAMQDWLRAEQELRRAETPD